MKKLGVIGVFMLLGLAQAAAPKYLVQADVVRGAPGAQGAVCVANSVFYPGEAIVWRVKVSDALTGKQLTPDQVKNQGVTVTIKVDNGVTKTLNFEGHPPGGKNPEYFFAGQWETKPTTPAGTLKWTATVKDKSGSTVVFQPIGQNVGLAVLTITPKLPAPKTATPAAPATSTSTPAAPAAPAPVSTPPAK